MATKLFYFSGTGNTLSIARTLADKLGDCELIAIPKVMDGEIDTRAERIGILFPVHAFTMPGIIARFIDKLEPVPGSYYFAVCTYGRVYNGTLKHVAKKLKARGIELSAGFAIRMPGNAIIMYDVWSEDTINGIIADAGRKVEEIAPKINGKKSHKIESMPFFVNWLTAGPRFFFSRQSPTGKDYWVDDNCDGCGICEAICPVGNIEIRENKPVWLKVHCEQCLSCLNICPKHAVQYKKATIERGRYNHPEIKPKDLLLRPIRND